MDRHTVAGLARANLGTEVEVVTSDGKKWVGPVQGLPAWRKMYKCFCIDLGFGPVFLRIPCYKIRRISKR